MSPGTHSAVLARVGQQVAAPTAVDADDRRFRHQHRPSRAVASLRRCAWWRASSAVASWSPRRATPPGRPPTRCARPCSTRSTRMGVLEAPSSSTCSPGPARWASRRCRAARQRCIVRRARPRRRWRRCAPTSPRSASTTAATVVTSDVLAWVPAMRDVDLALDRPAVHVRRVAAAARRARTSAYVVVRVGRPRSPRPTGWETTARRSGTAAPGSRSSNALASTARDGLRT